MITILRKEGWSLNPNDKVVNGILKMSEKNDGECPCHNNSEDKHCPCSDYRLNDCCHCNLYVKDIGVAQQVECWLWEPGVAGSSPVTYTKGDEKPWGKVADC